MANADWRLAAGEWRWRVMSGDTGDGRMANGEWRLTMAMRCLSSTLLERKGDSGDCLKPIAIGPLRWGGLGHLPYLVVA